MSSSEPGRAADLVYFGPGRTRALSKGAAQAPGAIDLGDLSAVFVASRVLDETLQYQSGVLARGQKKESRC